MNSVLTSEKFSSLLSKSRRGQELFPELIKRLIIASCNKIGSIRFPSGDAIWAPGFDGHIYNNTSEQQYVPLGDSVWELGTNSNSLNKINGDYKKRTESESDIQKNNFSFVLVIPHIWAHKQSIPAWEASKKANKTWKNVQLYDAEIICNWIEQNPEVGIWLLSELDATTPLDIDTFGTKWKKYTQITTPQFTTELMLTSNYDKKDELLAYITNGHKNTICIKSHQGTTHTTYFLLGCFHSCEKEISERVIFANSADSLNYLKVNCKDKIIITYANYGNILGNNNTYIIILPDSENAIKCDITLNYCTTNAFSKSLESMGYDATDAFGIAQKCNKNIAILRRKLSTEPLLKHPAWAEQDNKEIIIPLLLVSEIDARNPQDQKAMETIFGNPFNQYISQLDTWVNVDDSPIFKYGTKYKINSKEECSSIISINDIYYEKLFVFIKEYFSTKNPKYDLPKNKWGSAIFYGVQSQYNKYIINGILDSLILYAISGVNHQNKCDVFIRDLLDFIKTDNNLLLNISDYFDRIAELSPESYLYFLETEIPKTGSNIKSLIEDTYSDFITERSHLDEICWGLNRCLLMKETSLRALKVYLDLYFSPFVFPKHIDILRETATFLAPITTGIIPISAQDKLAFLKIYLEKLDKSNHNKICKLLEKVIYGQISSYFVPSGPRWRETSNTENCTYKEIFDFNDFAIEWLLNNSHSFAWLSEVFRVFPHLGASSVKKLFENLKAILPTLSDEIKAEIYPLILSQIYDMRFFDDPENRKEKKYHMNDFIQLAELSCPSNILLKYKYVFQSGYHDLPIINPTPYSSNDWIKENSNKRDALYSQALADIYKVYDGEMIDKILPLISSYCPIAQHLIKYISDYNSYIHNLITTRNNNLLKTSLYYIPVNEVIKVFDNSCEDDQKYILPYLPLNQQIVDHINNNSNENLFWESQSLLWINEEDYPDLLIMAISKMLHYNPAEVIRYCSLKNRNELDYDLSKAALMSFINSMKPDKSYDWDNIRRLISLLDTYPPDIELTKCEFALLALYTHEDYPLGIKMYFWNNPAILAELINNLFNDDFPNKTLKENLIFPLKHCVIPQEYITSEPQRLRDWVDIMLQAKSTNDKKQYIERTILRTLSFEKGSSDIWPSKHVVEIIELFNNYEILDEFVIAKINARSVRSVTDGEDEYKLAETYMKYADHYKLYQSTYYILRKLANHFRNNGDSDKAYSILD